MKYIFWCLMIVWLLGGGFSASLLSAQDERGLMMEMEAVTTTLETPSFHDVYRGVLKLEPDHELALQRIQQMLNFYQSQAVWTEAHRDRQQAFHYYRRYLTIEPDDSAIWDKIAELEAPPTPVPVTLTASSIATPIHTPTPRPTATPQPVLEPVAGQEWRDSVTGMEFVWIPDGCFQMGQTDVEKRELSKDVGEELYKAWFTDELPRHKICLDGFWMGKYEVTQAEWQKVMDNNPSYFKGNSRPVENVSWDDVQQFIQKLNNRSNATFRLPSEAEWEYACRAGKTTPFYFGETISTDQANYDGNYVYGSGKEGIYREHTTPVGSFPANSFGLYDMHGNVWEWCEDPRHENYQGAPMDGSVWSDGGNTDLRLLRGGSWLIDPGLLRCAYRLKYWRDDKGINRGMRLVRAAGGQ